MDESPKRRSGNKSEGGYRFWILTLTTGAIVTLLGAWIVAALTIDPAIPLSSAGAFLEKFHGEVVDPAREKDVWNTMTTKNYRRYVGLTYPKFREFWQSENPPDIVHISKDGPNTFSVLIVYHPKSGGNVQSEYAAVLSCNDWRARWSFGDCAAGSLLLDDTKHYDYRVLQG